MTRELHCADVGFDCEGVIKGESDDDVMEKAAAHARDVHGLTEVDAETAAKIRSQIHDAA